MKILIVLIFLGIGLPCAAIQSPSSLDSELSRIARDFKEVIMDEDECDKLKDKAEDIADEIEELLKKSPDFSPEEISQLRHLKTEAEGIEDFIAVVAGVGSEVAKLEDFIKANDRINADIYYFSKEELCVDLLIVEINDYQAFLVANNSIKNVTLNYEWKAKDKSSHGNSKSGMASKSIRHMLNNRDCPIINNIDFQNITCQEF